MAMVRQRLRPLLLSNRQRQGGTAMRIPTRLGFCSALLALLLFNTSSHAHHSFAAEFDGSNCRDFTGTLTALDWQSPHAYFYLDVADADGKVQNWSFQTYALITLRRNG